MALNQSWTEITNESDLDDYDWESWGDLSWTDLESINWDSTGTRGLKINYGNVSRSALSQNWSAVSR